MGSDEDGFEEEEEDDDLSLVRRREDRLLVRDPLLVGDTGMGLLGSLLLFIKECC